MFKVNNKTRRSSIFIDDFEHVLVFSSFSIADFQQVNVYWVKMKNSQKLRKFTKSWNKQKSK